MTVTIRNIGNSKGVIIPSHALKEAGIGKTVDICVQDDCIILKAVRHPREGWLEAIQSDPPEEESVLMEGTEDAEILENWTW